MSGADDPAVMHKAASFVQSLPFAQALGIRVDSARPGIMRMSLPWRAGLVGDQRRGILHGGVLSALIDTAAGAAVLCHAAAPCRVATMDLRIDYLRPARSGQRLTAHAECYRMGRTVAFVRGWAGDEDGDAGPVAHAACSFIVEM